MSHLCLHPARRGGIVRIAVIGRLDRQTAAAFTEHVSALIQDSGTVTNAVVLDLRCCIAMDADGATALEGIRSVVEGQGGVLNLESVPPLIEDVVRGTMPASKRTHA